jgi:hypothetical protein
MPHPVDVDTDPYVLTGAVPDPTPARAYHQAGGVRGLRPDRLHPPAQFSRRPQRIEQPEIVVGQERRGQPAHRIQDARANLRCASPLHHVGDESTESMG